jgi:hypothetical protein
VPGFTAWALPDLGAVPTDYEGAVMLTKDMMWDFGHYGFVGRYGRDGKPQPGVLGSGCTCSAGSGRLSMALTIRTTSSRTKRFTSADSGR